MKPLQFYVEEEQFKNLKLEAVERGMSVSELIRQCIIIAMSQRKPSTNPPKIIAKTPEEDVVVEKDDVIKLDCKHNMKGFGCDSRSCPNYGGL